ncbi:hypothetical protein C2S52_008289 [Perilla frutescens var. hirtella]|nr:hypothetical protein C2S52_008289 [Perilla frutescens var. hirtella]
MGHAMGCNQTRTWSRAVARARGFGHTASERAKESREFMIYLKSKKGNVGEIGEGVEGEIEYMDDETDNIENPVDEIAKRLKKRYLKTYELVVELVNIIDVENAEKGNEGIVGVRDKGKRTENETETGDAEKGIEEDRDKGIEGESDKGKEKGILEEEYALDFDSEDADFTTDDDSCDELLDNIIYSENIDREVEWAIRVRQKSLKNLQGSTTDQYSKLRDYADALLKKNPGSTVILQCENTDAGNKFRRFYVCLGAVKNGFKAFQKGSRLVVVIDGTHFKGKNKEILFVAAMKDGNEQILPIAIGLGPIENDESWKCHFPRAAHGLCYYHIQNKMAKHGAHMIAMFKEAVYAYRTDVFQRHMSALELVSKPAYQKLCSIGPEHWSRSQCPARCFCFMTSNAAESLNVRLL